MNEPVYRVVWPLGRTTTKTVTMKPRIGDLRGKSIGQLSHGGFRDPQIRPIVEEVLSRDYPGIRFVDKDFFGNIHGRNEAEVLAALPERLRASGVDAVISGIGS